MAWLHSIFLTKVAVWVSLLLDWILSLNFPLTVNWDLQTPSCALWDLGGTAPCLGTESSGWPSDLVGPRRGLLNLLGWTKTPPLVRGWPYYFQTRPTQWFISWLSRGISYQTTRSVQRKTSQYTHLLYLVGRPYYELGESKGGPHTN